MSDPATTPAPTTPVVLPVGAWCLDVPRLEDAPAVAAALADPEIALWNPAARNLEGDLLDHARAWVESRAAWADDHASWVVRDPDGLMIGAVSLHHLDATMATGEIGYWLVSSARGRGIGAAAVDAATRWGFESRGLIRLELFHAIENAASCRLAQRCGYLTEGTTRQSFVYGDGRRHDEHLHGRLAVDGWPAVPSPG